MTIGRAKRRHLPSGALEHGGQLSSVYRRCWRKLQKVTCDDSTVIPRKTKQSLPLLSRSKEVGLLLVAEGIVDLEIIFIFLVSALPFASFCIKEITFLSSFPRSSSLAYKGHLLALQLASRSGKPRVCELPGYSGRNFLGTFPLAVNF